MPPHIVRYPPIQCNTRERCDQLQIPAAPPAWRVPEGPDNLAAAPMGGGRAWPGFEGKLHHTQRHKRRRCGGCRRVRRARLRCPWAATGPGRASRRRAERSSQRGRLAGGPPPTGTHSGRARRRPEHQRRDRQQKPRNLKRSRGPVAEDGGFEPPRACTQHAFQACAIGH